jgi:hypothetical protein
VKEYVLEKNSDAKSAPKRVALVRRETTARLLEEQGEAVMSFPHLLVREILLIQLVVIALAVVSLFFNAPLETIADPDRTPNPAKAPWYFLGLQELLHYFPPVVAGVLLPLLVVVAVVIIPYVRVNLEVTGYHQRPARNRMIFLLVAVLGISVPLLAYRVWAVFVPTWIMFVVMALPALPHCPDALRLRLSRVPPADWIMTWFVIVAVTLTLIGTFFRGPGWSWVWPWQGGNH